MSEETALYVEEEEEEEAVEEREGGEGGGNAVRLASSKRCAEAMKAGRALSRAALTVVLVSFIILVLAAVIASASLALKRKSGGRELPNDPYQRALAILSDFPLIDG